MTVYNRQAYVAEAIESVLQQSRGDLELLVWDDGSTDGSLEIVGDYARRDSRIRLVEGRHAGAPMALKQACDAARGEYLGWVDSDDMLAPTALAETAAVLDSDPKIGLVYTHYLVMGPNGQMGGFGSRCKIEFSRERLLVDFMVFHFRLFRRELYTRVGGLDGSGDVGDAYDYDLVLKLVDIAGVAHVRRPLYMYRQHPTMISRMGKPELQKGAATAVRRAIQRRGLADKVKLIVTKEGRFRIRPIDEPE